MRRVFIALFALIFSTAAIADGINVPGPSYVAGTWTPTVTAATPGTPAYTDQIGSYEKVGRQVTARFNIVLSGWTGSPSGGVSIASLPVTSASTANDFGYCVVGNYTVTGLTALTYGITGIIAPSATSAALASNGSAGVSNVNFAQTGTAPTLRGVCFYRTD